jgi:Spy/CpxP family protein refolding chaperone
MKTTMTVMMIAILSIITMGGLVSCKYGRHGAFGFDEFDLEAAISRVASRLDLTETQKADLDQKVREIAEKAKSLHTDRETMRQELANLIRQASIDQAVVDELVTGKIENMKEMADFASVRLIEFHSTLTPEQRETIAERIEDHASAGCRFGFR